MKRPALIYFTFLVLFGSGIWALLAYGPANMPGPPNPNPPPAVSFTSWLTSALHQPLILLLMQIVVIIGFTRMIGNLFRPLGQPRVVVEIAAGIVLGPSVLGWVWPEAGAFIFPPQSLPALGTLSQIGLILFMFAVGMHLEPGGGRQRAATAIMISHGTMLLAFFIGVASAAWWLYPTYAGAGIGFVPFALFMGIALSVTAFPVLARILKEHQLTSTPVGALALTCAASDDLSAWCLLAIVMAIAKSGPLSGAAATIGFTIVYVVVMLTVVRPLLAKLLQRQQSRGDERTWMAMVLLLVLLSAMVTEIIGIHALFGAFFAGVIMPKDAALRARASERVEYVSELVLLPLFFALTGLRTQIGLLDQGHLWLVCVGIIALAVTGKLLGGAIIARLVSGFGWRESWLVGALLNTRGLMELVVLNIGYEMGILSPTIFTMLVLMALLTTVMTGPLIGFLTGKTSLDTVTLSAEPTPKSGHS